MNGSIGTILKRAKESWDVVLVAVVGIVFVGLALFADPRSLERWFAFMNVKKWDITLVVPIVLTCWFAFAWYRIFRGFKEETLDEYDMALAARFMRMSVFVTLTAWLSYVVLRPSVYEQMRLALDRMFRLGVYSAGWLTLFLLAVALVLTTVYFVVRWFMLRFFKM